LRIGAADRLSQEGPDMAYGFLDIAATASVKEAQRENGSADYWACFHGERAFDRFTENEAAFIAARDSFFMATVSESGWPYVQHRGGPAGFIRMLDDKTLAVADFRGNRQYITVGNVAAGGRASLILMDYANRRRLKIFAHVEIKNLADDPELAAAVATPGYKAKPERVLLFHLDAFDWNCPQHITQRFTEAEIDAALAPVRDRLAQLEAENKALRDKLAERDGARCQNAPQ
jgi:predicted pyridoxine 5'-phosphate oxidase superfamily flavin-nucleotide-binding protein